MVRIIVGTLIEVGNGTIAIEDIENIIKNGDRTKAGKCVAPNGLILEKVYSKIDLDEGLKYVILK